MTWTATYDHGNDSDVTYAKPRPHSAAPSWGTDVVAESANAADGRQRSFASLADGTDYSIFKRAGGSPAATDTVLAVLSNESTSAANISLRKNAQIARQLLTNKHVVTDNGNGTYDIAVRNDADDGDAFAVRGFNNVTGNRNTPSGIDVAEEVFE